MYPNSNVSHNKSHLLYSLLVSSHTNKSAKDNLKFHSQHSSTGSPTIIYFKLVQLSRRKGHNYADSQAHSQVGSQACRYHGWQNRRVNEIGEALPSSSARKQNNFYPVLNCLVLFHHNPNKRYDPKISVLSEPTTKMFLRCTSMGAIICPRNFMPYLGVYLSLVTLRGHRFYFCLCLRVQTLNLGTKFSTCLRGDNFSPLLRPTL